jgi:hypothetical protein
MFAGLRFAPEQRNKKNIGINYDPALFDRAALLPKTLCVLLPPISLNLFRKSPSFVFGQFAAPGNALHPKPSDKFVHLLR